ncbi:hypothetical protein VTO42DRAFT_7317 [Malbranchea cinnamomea]
MDAKPQRPVRALRIPRDENALPGHIHSTKTLHHRTKSTPALSTALTAPGVAKPSGKRTAFGDVSNTIATRPANDDASTKSKPVPAKTHNEVVTALAQPAQRLAVVSKPSVTTTTGLSTLDAARNKPVPVDRSQANTRKPLARRNTVYRDTLPSVPESGRAVPKEIDPNLKQESEFEQTEGAKKVTADSVNADNSQILVKDGFTRPESKLTEATVPHNTTKIKSEDMEKEDAKNYEKVRVLPTATISELHSNSNYDYPADITENTECWDEDYDENYDDDGYLTTKSHYARGDNTTGAATVVLFPIYDREAKQELAIAKKVVESKQKTAEDYEEECWDTSMVAEYGNEIFQYMRELERRLMPNPHYMDNQAEIQWSMRSVLMDWLVQVHLRFGLLPETLFLCVNYIDRFLSCKIVSLGKLQLVGATAIFIAAKYEEINCPSVKEIVYMVDNGYTEDEILKAERYMLSMLHFELGWPGPMSFLRRISKADDYDLETRTLAKYFLEVTIMDERFVGSPPSFIAAAAHCLSRLMLRKGTWTAEHVYYSNYTYSQLYPLMVLILECCEVPQKHHAAVYEKYTDKRFKRASYFVESEIARGFKLPDLYRDSLLSYYNPDGTPLSRLV